MTTPTWVELAGRNAAAEAVSITGSLEVSEPQSDRVKFRFSHAPGSKWRIEHAGQPVYLASGRTAVIRVNDQMQQLDGDVRLPILGAQFSPINLLGQDSLLHKMSAGMSVDDAVYEDTIGGRGAWSVRLLAPNGNAITLAFDNATGVLVRVANADGMNLLQVADLTEVDTLPDSLFVWEGPVEPLRNPRDRRSLRGGADADAERIEFMEAVVAGQAQPQEVLAAIAEADSENAARTALVELLGVSELGAEAIMATPIGQFRADHTSSNRRTLEILRDRHRQ